MEDEILHMNEPYMALLKWLTMWYSGKGGVKNIFKQKLKKGDVSNKIVS